MTNKIKSTYEREMKNVKFRNNFNKSYKKFLLSEISIIKVNELLVKDSTHIIKKNKYHYKKGAK
jgi:hypothetical protein